MEKGKTKRKEKEKREKTGLKYVMWKVIKPSFEYRCPQQEVRGPKLETRQ